MIERPSKTSESEIDAIVEARVDRLLALPPSHWDAEIEAPCEDRPELSDRVRERLRALADAGLLASSPQNDAEEEPPPSETGGPERIGHFRLLRELGTGGQGRVYLAEDTKLGRRVALKVLAESAQFSKRARARLKREAEALSRLDHPAICTVYDVGEDEGAPYIAMQLVEGDALADYVSTAKSTKDRTTEVSLPSADQRSTGSDATTQAMRPKSARIAPIVQLFEQVARALHEAHEAGLVHRDIKPGNIMVTRSGEPVLLDFGLARDEDSEDMTRTGVLMGTPAYMSPEQLTAKRIGLDRRSDVYSLGVTLYECLTLRLPFDVPTREAMYQAILSKPVLDPRKLNPCVPQDLRVVLETALEKDRDRRYATAEAFADDLRAVAESRPISARPISKIGRLTRWIRREPAFASLILTLAFAIPTIAGLAGYQIANLPDMQRVREQRRTDRVTRNLQQGFLQLSHHDIERTQYHLRAALADAPESPEAFAGLALSQLLAKRPDKALEELAPARHLEGRHPALARIRADAHRALGQPATAAKIEKELGEPSSPLDLMLEATRITHSADMDRERNRYALDLLTRAMLASPRARPLFYYERIQAGLRAHDMDAVRQTADAMVEIWPESADAWMILGEALSHYDRERAVTAFKKVLAIDPAYAPAHFDLAKLYTSEGRLAAAEACFLKHSELRPDNWRSRVNLGYTRMNMGDAERALTYFEDAVDKFPGEFQAYRGMSIALSTLGRHTEQAAILRKASSVLLEDPRPDTALGVALEKRGDSTGAIEAYRRAIEKDNTNRPANRRLVSALIATLQFEAVREHLTITARKYPDDPDTWLALARFLTDHNAHFDDALEAAVTAAERGCALEKDVRPISLDSLANAYFKSGDLDKAIATQQKALEAAKKSKRTDRKVSSRLRRSWLRFKRALKAKK